MIDDVDDRDETVLEQFERITELLGDREVSAGPEVGSRVECTIFKSGAQLKQ